ncbi:MAG: carboxypeptidase regulatory-like domain-containing protein [Anaerolineales bacterium]|nr:carboxypeptidase regulatory-like domain-containing protein [Anaerolineales bacterium]
MIKQQLKALLVTVGVLIALIATVFAANATAPALARAGGVRFNGGHAPHLAKPALRAACTKMQAGDVAWVTLTEDGEIEDQVDSYPSGTELITPVFEYPCVPKKVTIVSSFSLDGEVVYSDKESLKATNSSGLYGYPLGTTDGSAMAEGTWGIQFFNNKTLLTEGEVVIGEGGEVSDSVTVEGTVKDKKTKKAIKGATIIVLNPGVTVEDWLDNDQSEDDVYTAGQTNSKGVFKLEDPLTRNETYSLIVVAKGYKSIATDEFVIGDDVEDPAELNITLTK